MRLLRCLLALCVLFTGQLVAVSNSYAVSDYDNVIKTGGNFTVKESAFPAAGGICGPLSFNTDLAGSWSNIVTDPSRWYGNQWYPDPTTKSEVSDAIAAFQTARASGTGWAVIQNTAWQDYTTPDGSSANLKTGDTWLTVVYSDNPAATFRDDGPVGSRLSATGNWYELTIAYTGEPYHGNHDCVLGVTYARHGAAWDFPLQAANDPHRKSVFVNFGIAYPEGYEGAFPPIKMLPTYIAMGDSYSSGEGNAPFEYGTDTSSNTCHRSPQAWPLKIGLDKNFSTQFVACSGAVSDYIINEYNQENVELPQAAYITNDTKLVTISIGGNDIGFGNVLSTCTLASDADVSTTERHQIEHDACIDALEAAQGIATSAGFQNRLEAVFSGVRGLGSNDLQLVVAGYPKLFPSYNDIVGSCVWGNGVLTTSGRDVASDEMQKAQLLQDALNTAIEAAVDATNDSDVHFVDPTATFAGHELCRPAPWFNNVIPSIDPVTTNLSYHPNVSGQNAYAVAVGGEINILFP